MNGSETGGVGFLRDTAVGLLLRLIGGAGTRSYCVLVDADVRLVLGGTNCLAVVGERRLETLAVLAFGNVDWAGVVLVVGVYFNAGFVDISAGDGSEGIKLAIVKKDLFVVHPQLMSIKMNPDWTRLASVNRELDLACHSNLRRPGGSNCSQFVPNDTTRSLIRL